MANTRSAEKQQRQAEKNRSRNRAVTSRLRTELKKARATVDTAGDHDKTISGAFSEIDLAAKKGVIKKNTANRYKSRLAAASKRTKSA